MDTSLGKRVYDPRVGADRIQALLSSFTSPAYSCPFFNRNVRSTCVLDPRTRRAWNCQGTCFIEGFCCDRVLNKSDEIEELIHGLQFFHIKWK
ncbi:MAG: hypothetical protein ACTSQI_13770 [Candidatus Helarchaeota archaeon]